MPRSPAPCSLAPGLPLSRRPAPPSLRAIVVALTLVLLLPSISTATTVVIDETFSDRIDTSSTESIIHGGSAYYTYFSSIVLNHIENHATLNYVAFVLPNVAGMEPLPEGRHDITYQIESGKTGTGVLYVAYNRAPAGNVISYRFTVFFYDWDIGELTGRKYIKLDKNIGRFGANGAIKLPSNYVGGIGGTSKYNEEHLHAGIDYTFTVVSSIDFKNRLTVTEDNSVYNIDLKRNIDGKSFASAINLMKNATSIYRDYSASDITLFALTDEIDAIKLVTTSNKEYVRSLSSSGDPGTSTPVTVYVRNSQTGALLANAHVTISAATGDPPTLTEAVNATLPGGTGTYELERADYLKYHASATADDYTLLSPIIFGVPEGGTTIALWMAPDAPPDEPIEEGKSMLYGYVQTQGSQQPISGATVSLDGYGSTTTSSTGFYLFNNVTPGAYTISASAPLHDALSEPVTVETVATPYNLALKGHFLLTVSAKNADDLTTLHNTTISLSDGQESTQNPATFNVDYGPYTITAAAGGYYPQTQSAYLDKPGTTTATVLMTAIAPTPTPPEMPNYPPHNVKFTVQTIFGTPIPSVNVTAQGIQQTPSTNILERLLGLNMTSTPITTELMSGTTDTNGEINFMMIEVVKYRISLYKPDVINQILEIYPKEDTYPIIISTGGGPLLPDAGDALRDILINVTTSTEGDTGHIHIDYNDTTRKTTGLSIQVTQQNTTDSSAPEDVIASHTVANDANVTHTFDLSVYKGQSFFVRLEAEHPDFGTINRDYAVAFKGVRVPLGPLPDGLYIYVAGFGLMLLGGIFGATSATRGVVVIALAGWLFYAFGWLDDLGLIAPVSLGLVSTIAVMGVVVTRYREEGYQ